MAEDSGYSWYPPKDLTYQVTFDQLLFFRTFVTDKNAKLEFYLQRNFKVLDSNSGKMGQTMSLISVSLILSLLCSSIDKQKEGTNRISLAPATKQH